MWGCRGLAGEKDAAVEFKYDGAIPTIAGSSLSNPVTHKMLIRVVDTDIDFSHTEFVFAEISPHQIATLEGHRDRVEEVSFSPDGTILASGAVDGTVRLWDMETRQEIATLEVGSGVYSVSFSPDGTILASGANDGTVRLWDMRTREQTGILERNVSMRMRHFAKKFTVLFVRIRWWSEVG